MGQINWRRVNEDRYEYAIQQGPHGDEFVKLLDGSCLRRPLAEDTADQAMMDWKAEADRRTREVEQTYFVQKRLQAEINRLRSSLSVAEKAAQLGDAPQVIVICRRALAASA